jgi:hypothetical protein
VMTLAALALAGSLARARRPIADDLR